MKQTAVDWLIEQIESCKITLYIDGDRRRLISLGSKDDLIKKAKALMEEQVKDAYGDGLNPHRNDYANRDEYYLKTFIK
jgi:hypothetical protein